MKDKIYIERIIKYCEKIIKYVKTIDEFSDFEVNEEKIDAVMLNLEQIGETAKKLSENTKKQYPSIHWISIIGLRNMISHDYEGLKLNIIYEIAKINIPELYDKLIV